ncbi:MAG: hypothetical protein OXE52_16520 [Chloroflexi bacterium]|nr:hypothetical protein [Chloroflexota bacterium]
MRPDTTALPRITLALAVALLPVTAAGGAVAQDTACAASMFPTEKPCASA